MKDAGNVQENENVKWFTIPITLPEKLLSDKDQKTKTATKNDVNFKRRADEAINEQNGRDFFKKSKLEDDSAESEVELDSETFARNAMNKATRKKCALIIDDTKVIRKVFVRALTTLGYEVKQAENGLKGLLQMKATMFDVVFCDFLMPLLDGLDCVQQYRAWEKENRNWFQQVREVMSFKLSFD